MSNRKHISWKTRCASALLQAGHVPYSDAKLMTEDQFLSLFHFDHNILHSTGHLDADKFWNLAPMLIRAHREKTKTDAKVIAKGRRIRGDKMRWTGLAVLKTEGKPFDPWEPIREKPKRKLASRGFDKTRTRKMDGTIVKRER